MGGDTDHIQRQFQNQATFQTKLLWTLDRYKANDHIISTFSEQTNKSDEINLKLDRIKDFHKPHIMRLLEKIPEEYKANAKVIDALPYTSSESFSVSGLSRYDCRGYRRIYQSAHSIANLSRFTLSAQLVLECYSKI